MIEAHSLPGVPEHYFYCDESGKLRDPLPPAILLEYGFWDVLRGSLLIFRAKGDEEASATCSKGMVEHIVTFLGDEY